MHRQLAVNVQSLASVFLVRNNAQCTHRAALARRDAPTIDLSPCADAKAEPLRRSNLDWVNAVPLLAVAANTRESRHPSNASLLMVSKFSPDRVGQMRQTIAALPDLSTRLPFFFDLAFSGDANRSTSRSSSRCQPVIGSRVDLSRPDAKRIARRAADYDRAAAPPPVVRDPPCVPSDRQYSTRAGIAGQVVRRDPDMLGLLSRGGTFETSRRNLACNSQTVATVWDRPTTVDMCDKWAQEEPSELRIDEEFRFSSLLTPDEPAGNQSCVEQHQDPIAQRLSLLSTDITGNLAVGHSLAEV